MNIESESRLIIRIVCVIFIVLSMYFPEVTEKIDSFDENKPYADFQIDVARVDERLRCSIHTRGDGLSNFL